MPMQLWASTNYPPLKIDFLRIGGAFYTLAADLHVIFCVYQGCGNNSHTCTLGLILHSRSMAQVAVAVKCEITCMGCAGTVADERDNVVLVDLLEYCK